MLKIGTLFSGIGSFEWALSKLNIEHEIQFACDNGDIELELDYDEEIKKIKKMKTYEEQVKFVDSIFSKLTRKTNFVKQSYLANYELPEEKFYQDVKLFDGSKFKNKLDILVGGSPCQSFSTVGKVGGLNDTRGTLFYEYARIVNESKPKMFIYENVKGLFTHDKGNTWKVMQKVFHEIGYHFTFKLLNSKDYGVPQNRTRLIVVGFRNKKNLNKFNYPIEKTLKYSMQNFLIDEVDYGNFTYLDGDIQLVKSTGIVNKKTFLSASIRKYVLSSGTKKFKTSVKTDLQVARTILATMNNRHRAGVDNYITYDKQKLKIRMLDTYEALRLMGFDDTFKHVVSRPQIYKQAGNSIVVNLFIEIIKNNNFIKKL